MFVCLWVQTALAASSWTQSSLSFTSHGLIGFWIFICVGAIIFEYQVEIAPTALFGSNSDGWQQIIG